MHKLSKTNLVNDEALTKPRIIHKHGCNAKCSTMNAKVMHDCRRCCSVAHQSCIASKVAQFYFATQLKLSLFPIVSKELLRVSYWHHWLQAEKLLTWKEMIHSFHHTVTAGLSCNSIQNITSTYSIFCVSVLLVLVVLYLISIIKTSNI